VRWPVLERPQRRELARQPGDHELGESLRARQVLEPVLAEVAERDAVRKLVLDQLARRLREQRLAAVRGGADPGGARDIEPDVPGGCTVWLAGVEADPHGQPGRGQLALEPSRSGHGISGALE